LLAYLRRHRSPLAQLLLVLVAIAWTNLAWQPCPLAGEALHAMAAADPQPHPLAAQHPLHHASAEAPCHGCPPSGHATHSHLLGCDDGRCQVMSDVEAAAALPAPSLAAAWQWALEPQPILLQPVVVALAPHQPPPERFAPLPAERIPPSPIYAFRVLRI